MQRALHSSFRPGSRGSSSGSGSSNGSGGSNGDGNGDTSGSGSGNGNGSGSESGCQLKGAPISSPGGGLAFVCIALLAARRRSRKASS